MIATPTLKSPSNRTSARDNRLQSIARYESYYPQALACSYPLNVNPEAEEANRNGYSYSKRVNKSGDATGNQARKNLRGTDPQAHPPEAPVPGPLPLPVTSLGAVAGSDGIALFRTSQPHVPLMILSHASASQTTTSSSNATTAVSSLSFSPLSAKGSLSLASARGTGILIWDVSGHSLSPLQGRLGIDHNHTDAVPSHITSLTWMNRGTQVAATTAAVACVWDLRVGASLAHRPSLRLGVTSTLSQLNNHRTTSAAALLSFRQIACADRDEEFAVLDSNGFVRIFDARMVDRASRTLHQFEAHSYAGVGLSFLPVTRWREKRCWVTWGLDSPKDDAVVKIWIQPNTPSTTNPSADGDHAASAVSTEYDDYWFMDTSPVPPTSRKTPLASDDTMYRLAGRCTTPHLACARVCPSPVEDSILTVGLSLPKGSKLVGGWTADLWKLTFDTTSPSGDYMESKLEKRASFQSNPETESELCAVLGNDPPLFALRASELAISSYSETKQGSTYGLLLCSLTSNGHVLTHAIPEALPGHSERDLHSDQRGCLPILTQHTRLFPRDSDVTIEDAARAWIRATEPLLVTNLTSRRDISIGSGAVDASLGMSPAALNDGAGMPFDMDAPLQLSSLSIGNPGLPGVGKGGSMSPITLPVIGSFDDGDPVDLVARDSSQLMSSIDTDQIPCPRLCGAVFSPGVGGLVAFHNGDVKKTWGCWAQKDQARVTVLPSYAAESSISAASESMIHRGINRGNIGETSTASVLTMSAYPRTMKDLLTMTTAVRASKWGEPDESETSLAGFPALGITFFDDDSESSSDSGQGDEVPYSSTTKDQQRINGNYFGGYQRPFATGPERDKLTEMHESKGNFHSTAGLSSGMISPTVKVSHEFDQISLQKQSRGLALAWKLGDFKANGRSGRGGIASSNDRSLYSCLDSTETDHLIVPQSPFSKRALPSYRSLLPAMAEPTRTISEDERGVHGGEYSVRPNMQESMVFLRKLFTQQHNDGGKVSFPTMLSPPDSPMLSSKQKSLRKLAPSQGAAPPSRFIAKNSSGNEKLSLGVYTRLIQPPTEDEELKSMEEICLYNADVSQSFSDPSGVETWKLIAKVVRNTASIDRWCGIGGKTMSTELLNKVLRYFETLGDVQMLATLVCVLRSRNPENRGYRLLPLRENARYDRYILRYANLLYGWGLLTTRVEVIKHLWRPMPVDESLPTDFPPVIAFVFLCPHCATESEHGYCISCNDFSFRCAICENAVRGLFVTCDSCGHGGHVNHITEWFASNNTQCPTGCGCKCREDYHATTVSGSHGSSGFIRPTNSEHVLSF